jgi:hypothetical protein
VKILVISQDSPAYAKGVDAIAWSLYDFDLAPETGTGRIHRRALVSKSLTGTESIPCRACSKPGETKKGSGWRRDRFGRPFPCEACGGFTEPDGTLHKGKGKLAYDPYDNNQEPRKIGADDKPIAPAVTLTRKCLNGCRPDEKGKNRLANGWTCPECRGKGRVRIVPLLDVSEEREASDVDPIERRDRAGSYAELEDAIRRIAKHVNKPEPFKRLINDDGRLARDLYHRVWVGSTDDNIPLADLPPMHRELAELARRYVISAMPSEIRVPAGVVYAWERRNERDEMRAKVRNVNGTTLNRRDEMMLLRLEAGESVPSLAAEYGLKERGVQAACARAREHRERARRRERKSA